MYETTSVAVFTHLSSVADICIVNVPQHSSSSFEKLMLAMGAALLVATQTITSDASGSPRA